MKKGKVFGKGQAVLALMVLALGAAVWLNMKFSSSNKYLGEATYVSNQDKTSSAAYTSAKTDAKTDYFADAQKGRKTALEKSKKAVEEIIDTDKLTDEDKATAMQKINELASRIEKESNIETLLKAKGFEKAVVVIGDKNINVVVKSDGLTTAQTLQIQDIVTSESEIDLSNIKIVTVK